MKKNSPIAQTTRLASFGHVLVISVLPAAYFVDNNCIYYKTLVSIYKKHERKGKKTHLWPKRRVRRRLSPFLSSPTSLSGTS